MKLARKISGYLLIAAGIVFGAGCSGENPAETAAANSPTKTSTPAPSAASGAKSTNVVRQSVFSVDSRLRDPFYPQAKRTPDPVVTAVNKTPEPQNVERQLREAFQGVFGVGRSRIALINNVMLETGRTVSIPVRSGNQQSEVVVRVKEVLSNGVILEAQGRTITISGGKQ